MRNSHLPMITLTLGGRGTNVQVRLSHRALNSSCIAASQSGSCMAARTEIGGGEGPVEATYAYFMLGRWMPARARVTTGAERG